MKKLLLMLLVFVIVVSGCSRRTTKLHDGKSFKGWQFYLEDKAVDPADVWSIRGDVVHCTGTPNGYMQTTGWYSDYMLHLEWRWTGQAGNSGVLLHTTGPDKVWPKSVECQLQSGDAGDFWLIDGPGLKANGNFAGGIQGKSVNVKKKHPSNEKPAGQWNTYDIYCQGDTIKCYVNGLLQNEGTDLTDTSGRIALQSEGVSVQFRNIYIQPLK